MAMLKKEERASRREDSAIGVQSKRQKKRAYGTPDSHVVPHRSTDRACSGLTAQFGRDTVLFTEYGRRRLQKAFRQSKYRPVDTGSHILVPGRAARSTHPRACRPGPGADPTPGHRASGQGG